ncbi:MAG: FtsX-like permease family protein, partial [Acidobacteriota bacterium]
ENAVWEIDPEQTLSLSRLSDIVDRTTRHRRFTIAMLAAFAALALILTVVGVYGLMAYTVSRRTPEIGLRMALGARPLVVLAGILRWAVGLAALGTVLGGVAAWAGARLLDGLLFGVATTDTSTLVAVPIILLLTALAGALAPALRAMRIEPTRALRHE